MLPKSSRLTTKEIAGLKKGKSAFGALISLRFIPATSSKFAVSVSKKEASFAVIRNKIRRKVYEVLKGVKKDLHFPIHAMIIPKKEILGIPHTDLIQEIRTIFKKSKLI